MSGSDHYDVIVVGGGVAGLSAATFTARHDLDTAVLSAGGSLLHRNAHLENYPGFPAGIDARLLLELLEAQAERAGSERYEATVTRVVQSETTADGRDGDRDDDGDDDGNGDGDGDGDGDGGEDGTGAPTADDADGSFTVETADGTRRTADAVVAATKNSVDYLDDVEGLGIVDRGKTFVDTDERGRTGVDGLYAAGRLAEKPHQAIVAAGHGAEVAVTLLEERDVGFYHDWVAPEGYFTGRDRDVPPGCEEIDDAERRERARASIEVLHGYLDEANLTEPEQHPDVR